MKNILRIGFLSLACILFGCKSTKNISPDTFEGRQIRFGSGGGYTGAVTQWALLDNGRLWGVSGKPTAVLQSVGKVPKKAMNSVFAAIDSVDISKPINVPGNMYRFLEIYDGDGVTKMVWDPSQKGEFTALDAVFDQLKVIMQEAGPAPIATATTESEEEN